MRSSVPPRLLAAMLTLLLCTGCADAPGSGTDPESRQTLRVFAAASLQQALTPLTQEFTAQTGAQVQLSSAGSADLLAQLEQGAPADVFIPADSPTMERARSTALIDASPVTIASNTLVIAVPAGNPAQVRSLQDLADPSLALVLCAPQVPCGATARQVSESAGVTLDPVSEELAVTDVLGKVRSGEADAGLVYSTDAQRAADEVETIEIEAAQQHPNRYPAAVLAEAQEPELAEEFIALLRGESGQAALEQAGFQPAGFETAEFEPAE